MGNFEVESVMWMWLWYFLTTLVAKVVSVQNLARKCPTLLTRSEATTS